VNALRKSWAPVALFAAAVLVLAGCQEDLAGGAACPTLCPDTLTIKDTVLVGSAILDTAVTLPGLPPLGSEQQLLLADYSQGDSPVKAVAVMRFDVLQTSIADTDTTKLPHPIVATDSAFLVINVQALADSADTTIKNDSVTFLAYDVDAPATDLDTAPVRQRFSSTPIGSRRIARDSIVGQISIPVDSAFVSRHVLAKQRIRLGLRATGDKPVNIRIGSVEGGGASSLRYTALGDSGRRTEGVVSVNTHAASGPSLPSLADYTLVLAGTPPSPPGVLAAGGIPSTRIFLRFKIPPELVDSSITVVRANLELHQLPNLDFASVDTLLLQTLLVRATPEVTDIFSAALLAVDPASALLAIPPQMIPPAASRTDTIPLQGAFALWKSEHNTAIRAIELKTSNEGFDPRQYYFYSSTAADSLRPRLRLSYILRSNFGLP
jgi:hypothetical protein